MKCNFKKVLAASLTCMLLTGVSATAMAGYSLSSEVKKPTPSLMQATQIGVRSYVTSDPQLLKQQDKEAIVVLSFGTTFKDTRSKTIDATVKEIQKAHPDTKVVVAFTSHIIIDRIKANEGLTIPTPEEALEQLKQEGYNSIALTSLDIIPGMEYAYKTAVYDQYKTQFKKMTIGTPLMYWMGQEGQADDVEETMKAIKSQLPSIGSDDAVLLMAHGTPDTSNAYYYVMQDRLNSLYGGKVLIYTVEGSPRLEHIIPQLKEQGVKNIALMPMMMVAGDHANNDMAGAEEDSHKSILEKAGFKVKAYVRGLGENKDVRKLFVERANASWEALQQAGK